MSNEKTIVERLRALFLESFHIEVPASDADLLENGILDSFQLVELLFQLERQFGLRIAIEDIDLDDLRTLERIARLVVANSGSVDVSPPGRPTTHPGKTQAAPSD